ncbi:MAG: hypothetical protein VYA46_08885 [Verrucomicrobiota bacterium]|nr:hypothetical protein [Verrucomicrobiota bacterium]
MASDTDTWKGGIGILPHCLARPFRGTITTPPPQDAAIVHLAATLNAAP